MTLSDRCTICNNLAVIHTLKIMRQCLESLNSDVIGLVEKYICRDIHVSIYCDKHTRCEICKKLKEYVDCPCIRYFGYGQ